MKSDIFGNVITALKANTTLVGLLGTATQISAPNNLGSSTYPYATVKGEDGLGEKRTGYRSILEREQEGFITVEVYVKTAWKDADDIVSQIDKTLISDTVTSTWGWKKVSDSNIWIDEEKTYKKTMRYSFNYLITDS